MTQEALRRQLPPSNRADVLHSLQKHKTVFDRLDAATPPIVADAIDQLAGEIPGASLIFGLLKACDIGVDLVKKYNEMRQGDPARLKIDEINALPEEQRREIMFASLVGDYDHLLGRDILQAYHDELQRLYLYQSGQALGEGLLITGGTAVATGPGALAPLAGTLVLSARSGGEAWRERMEIKNLSRRTGQAIGGTELPYGSDPVNNYRNSALEVKFMKLAELLHVNIVTDDIPHPRNIRGIPRKYRSKSPMNDPLFQRIIAELDKRHPAYNMFRYRQPNTPTDGQVHDSKNYQRTLEIARQSARFQYIMDTSSYLDFPRFAVARSSGLEGNPFGIKKLAEGERTLLKNVRTGYDEGIYRSWSSTYLQQEIARAHEQNDVAISRDAISYLTADSVGIALGKFYPTISLRRTIEQAMQGVVTLHDQQEDADDSIRLVALDHYPAVANELGLEAVNIGATIEQATIPDLMKIAAEQLEVNDNITLQPGELRIILAQHIKPGDRYYQLITDMIGNAASLSNLTQAQENGLNTYLRLSHGTWMMREAYSSQVDPTRAQEFNSYEDMMIDQYNAYRAKGMDAKTAIALIAWTMYKDCRTSQNQPADIVGDL